MSCDLKIHKKYLLKVEQYTKFGYAGSVNPFSCRYIFLLPDDSVYKDYAIYVDTIDCKYDKNGKLILDSVGVNYELKGNYYHLNLNEDKLIAFKCINRESGKRYKRYTLSLNDIFALYNGVDLSDLSYAIAYVTQYRNNGKKNAGEIVSKFYTIGKLSDKWMYFEGSEKRRINTKGIEIIGKIPFDKVQEAKEIIKNYYFELRQLDSKCTDIYCLINRFNKVCDSAYSIKESSAYIVIIESCEKEKARLQDEMLFIDEQIKLLDKELLSKFNNIIVK